MKPSPVRREVVLVEDDVHVRDSLRALLDMEGYDVRAHRYGAALLDSIRNQPRPAVVILDLTLPDMSGGRCLSLIRASAWAEVPVLIFSGWSRLERMGLGAEVFSKACEPESILRAVRRLAGGALAPTPPRSPAARAPRRRPRRSHP